MIVPSYLATASERVLPSFTVDFTTAVLDARVAITRALNTATIINSNGLIQTVNADLPRFSYDPITLRCLGLLVEETRFNAHTSSGLYDATWAIANVTANAIDISTSPTGTGTKFLETTASAQHLCDFARFFHAASSTVTHSRWLRSGLGRDYVNMGIDDNAGNGGQCVVNLATGAILSTSNTGTGTNSTSTIQAFSDGWYRVSISTQFTAPSGQSRGICFPYQDASLTVSYAGDTSKGLYVTGAQIEAGASVTSYIPTTTAAVTRNSDVAAITGGNFSGWWKSTTGSMLVQAQQSTITGTRPWVHISDGTANNIIALRGNAADPELYIKATTDQAQLDAGTLVSNTRYGLTGAWTTNNCATAFNGGTPTTSASATIPTVDRMLIGSDGSNYINGLIARVMFWPQRITNAETQAFSKL